MKTFKLTPINGRKTLNNQLVIDKENSLELISYETKVAEYYKAKDKVKIFGWFSSTTANHINAFLSYLGKPTMTKQEMIKLSKN